MDGRKEGKRGVGMEGRKEGRKEGRDGSHVVCIAFDHALTLPDVWLCFWLWP